MTPEGREKLRAAALGNKRGRANKGRVFKQSTLEKMAKAKLGTNWRRGKWDMKLAAIDPTRQPNGYGLKIGKAVSEKRFKAMNRGLTWELSKYEAAELLVQDCHYCGSKPGSNYGGIDRKDNSLGYHLENCLPCCFSCNSAKGTKTYADFLEWLKQISKKWF